MCVIIHKPAGKAIKEEDFITAATKNDDGFGYMYADPVSQKVIADKCLFNKPEDLLELLKSQEHLEVVYHLRIKTHGPISQKNCHPFKVLSKEKHGMDLYFMHNGIISGVKEIDDESDTRAFNRQILKPLLKMNKKFLYTDTFKLIVEDFVGSSKLVFMTGLGEVLKFNERLGDTHDGMWVSNKHSFAKPITYPTYQWNNTFFNRKVESQEKVEKVVDAMGSKLKLNDTTLIFSNTDPQYVEEGKVTSVGNTYIGVTAKDLKGIEKEIWFKASTLESSNFVEDYYLLPMCEDSTCLTAKIENLTEPEPTEVEEEEVSESLVHVKDFSIKDVTFDALDFKYDTTLTVDSLTPYPFYEKDKITTKDITVLDVYNMTYQERFDFYLNNYQTSFSMFQDLIDQIVNEDMYYGLIENDEVANEAK